MKELQCFENELVALASYYFSNGEQALLLLLRLALSKSKNYKQAAYCLCTRIIFSKHHWKSKGKWKGEEGGAVLD